MKAFTCPSDNSEKEIGLISAFHRWCRMLPETCVAPGHYLAHPLSSSTHGSFRLPFSSL